MPDKNSTTRQDSSGFFAILGMTQAFTKDEVWLVPLTVGMGSTVYSVPLASKVDSVDSAPTCIATLLAMKAENSLSPNWAACWAVGHTFQVLVRSYMNCTASWVFSSVVNTLDLPSAEYMLPPKAAIMAKVWSA